MPQKNYKNLIRTCITFKLRKTYFYFIGNRATAGVRQYNGNAHLLSSYLQEILNLINCHERFVSISLNVELNPYSIPTVIQYYYFL